MRRNGFVYRCAGALLAILAAQVLDAGLSPARATDVCGAVCDTTWTAVGNPYIVTCDVTVAASCALIVDDGVDVRFRAGTALVIDGSLDVQGESTSAVEFLSDAATPAAGDWRGLELAGSSTVSIVYASVRDGDNGIHVMDDATVTLDHVISRSNVNGLRVRGTGPPSLHATDCQFIENDGRGVHITADAPGIDVAIHRSQIHSNGTPSTEFFVEKTHLYESPDVVNARENWWGTASTWNIGGMITDATSAGMNDVPIVDWCGYLDSPGGSPRDALCPDLSVAGPVTLDRTDKPYLVTSVMKVRETGTLTVAAGVEIRFAYQPRYSAFLVRGELQINGSSSQPVTLLSDRAEPSTDWTGVTLDGGTATIEHAEILHGGKGLYASAGATATLDDVALGHCVSGLWVWGDSETSPTTVSVSNSRITDNHDQGVLVSSFAAPNLSPVVTITNTEFHANNPGYGDDWHIRAGAGAPGIEIPPFQVVARHNWWNTTDPILIARQIVDDQDNGEGGTVDWCEWLDGAGGDWRPMYCPAPTVCDETVTWDQTDKPYILMGDTTVCPTGTLTIGPGVTVRAPVADPTVALIVEGTLDVNGLTESSVTFTSDAAVATAGDWSGLRLHSGSTSTIDHAEITYAERAVHVFEASTATLVGVTATQNQDGLYLYGNLNVDVTESAFVQNERYGVYAQGVSFVPDPTVWIRQSQIHTNGGGYDVYLDGGFSTPAETIFRAEDTWWGTTEPAAISARIRDRVDYTGNALVDWCAPLESAGGAPAAVSCLDPDVCGEIEILDETDEPYLVISNIEVCPTGTLQIEAGVEMRVIELSPSIRINVQGVLDVNGTEGSPVLLTSDATVPQALDWRGISLMAGSISDLDHLTVEYADRGIEVLATAQAALDGVTSARNRYGLYVQGYGGPPTVDVTGSTFTENTYYGVNLTGNPNPNVTIVNSSLFGNLSTYDFYASGYTNPARTVLRLWDNFWGDADAERIGSRIHGQRRNTLAPVVDYCHYLDAAPPAGVRARDVHCPDLVACDAPVTWDLTDKPYQVVTDVRVCNGQTLTIGPGVEARVVNTTPQPDFRVEGTLDVNGTTGSPVLLTSDASVSQALDWQGLYLTTGSTSQIEHATIEYANKGIEAVSTAQVSLDGVTSARNRYGLYVQGYGGPPTVDVTGSTFTENTYYGVQLTGNPNPNVAIVNSSLFGNLSTYDFYASGYTAPTRTVVRMWDNFWGDADAERIGSRIHGQRRNTLAPVVDYCHYLDVAPPAGVRARDVHCPDLVACDAPVTWDLTDKPYQVVTDVRVCNGETLTIGPGVEARVVNTTPQPDFRVEGTLDVNGTGGSPVLLTSDAAARQALDWQGLYLTTGSTSDLEHLTVEYATRGIEVLSDAQVSMDGVTSARNRYGLYVQGYGGPPTVNVAGSTFTENTYYGVNLTGNPNPDVTISTSSLLGNLSSYDLYTAGYASPATSIVWVTDNWWGTTNPSTIDSRIYDRSDSTGSPRVYYRAFGDPCDWALGADRDGDGRPDFDDNCPEQANGTQSDADGDLMGDACDPEPALAPSGACDGTDDVLDGYLDADGDGWGDPCDQQPLRADSHPGAVELCDARDNDGDGAFGAGERVDEDLDGGILCGDCDDLEPLANVCACEECNNVIDDDCDTLADGADAECALYASCIVLTAGTEPSLQMDKGVCGGATLTDPYDVIRGRLADVQFSGGSVDLGTVSCVAGEHPWDRATDSSTNLNPKCEGTPVLFYLAKNGPDDDYGAASSGERRDVMVPDPACP